MMVVGERSTAVVVEVGGGILHWWWKQEVEDCFGGSRSWRTAELERRR